MRRRWMSFCSLSLSRASSCSVTYLSSCSTARRKLLIGYLCLMGSSFSLLRRSFSYSSMRAHTRYRMSLLTTSRTNCPLSIV
jgi:hypothetical protein